MNRVCLAVGGRLVCGLCSRFRNRISGVLSQKSLDFLPRKDLQMAPDAPQRVCDLCHSILQSSVFKMMPDAVNSNGSGVRHNSASHSVEFADDLTKSTSTLAITAPVILISADARVGQIGAFDDGEGSDSDEENFSKSSDAAGLVDAKVASSAAIATSTFDLFSFLGKDSDASKPQTTVTRPFRSSFFQRKVNSVGLSLVPQRFSQQAFFVSDFDSESVRRVPCPTTPVSKDKIVSAAEHGISRRLKKDFTRPVSNQPHIPASLLPSSTRHLHRQVEKTRSKSDSISTFYQTRVDLLNRTTIAPIQIASRKSGILGRLLNSSHLSANDDDVTQISTTRSTPTQSRSYPSECGKLERQQRIHFQISKKELEDAIGCLNRNPATFTHHFNNLGSSSIPQQSPSTSLVQHRDHQLPPLPSSLKWCVVKTGWIHKRGVFLNQCYRRRWAVLVTCSSLDSDNSLQSAYLWYYKSCVGDERNWDALDCDAADNDDKLRPWIASELSADGTIRTHVAIGFPAGNIDLSHCTDVFDGGPCDVFPQHRVLNVFTKHRTFVLSLDARELPRWSAALRLVCPLIISPPPRDN